MRNMRWPFDAGIVNGILMILIYFLVVIPIMFICLSAEHGVKEAWKTIWEG